MIFYLIRKSVLIVLLATLPFVLSAQLTEPFIDHCATVETEERLRLKYPGQFNKEDFEQWLAPLVRRYQEQATPRAVLKLPIIFHIIHYGDPLGSGDNVPDNFVYSQIEQINNDFRRKAGTSGFNDNPVGADSEIEFCPAAVDPNGIPLPMPGIHRVDATQETWGPPPYSSSFTDTEIKPNTQFDPERYINVWVLSLSSNTPGSTLLGYAQFPSQSGLDGLPTDGGAASSDGVAIAPFTVGSTTNPNPDGGSRFGRGRTLTHELGHFFGLRHIWGDGNCFFDDFCDDTPEASSSSTGCAVGKTTCGSLDMIENYMDYSDDECMNIFTQDQKARMQAVLSNSPRRVTLPNSPACGPVTLTANFNANPANVTLGGTVNFTDLSPGNPTTWSWSFPGGTPSSSTQQNPSVTYNTPGSYAVTLTVSDGIDSDTRTIDGFITVSSSTACVSGIATFPYTESFETGLGDWQQSTDDDIDWTRDNNGTPSFGTGPNNAADGTFYLYTEASNGNDNSTATLNSPCFDLSQLSNAEISFQYHMTGSGQGTLSLQASINGSDSWTTLWSQSGDQGDRWYEQKVDLSTYIGPDGVSLRFVGRTGPSFESDMAIDDIEVRENTNTGPAPVAEFSADATAIDEGQTVNFSDLSSGNPDSWSWTFTGGTPGASSSQNPAVTYNTAGSYTVSLTVSNANGNDTETKNAYITVNPVSQGGSCTADISSFPYAESFESNLGAWTQASDDDIDWTRDSGGTPSSQTGPSDGAEGSFYLYTESSGSNNNKTAILNSPCFDLSGVSAASFEFAYHMYGVNTGSLAFQVSTDDGQNWSTLWFRTGDQGNQWLRQTIDLAAYLGGTVQFRFEAQTGSSFRSDMAIDDLNLSSGGGSGTAPVADFSANATTIDEGQTINFTDLSIGNPDNWSWTFAGGTPGSSSSQNPSVTYNTAGNYTVSLTVSNANGNDTETKNAYITVNPAGQGGSCTADISSFPYTESFESNLGAWTQAGNDDIDWTRDSGGTPSNQTGPSNAADGNFYLYTESSGNNSNKTAILNSPCFDLSGASAASFEFAYHMYGTNTGTLAFQISVDNGQNWNTLWSLSGDQGNQWLRQTIDLSAYLGGTVQFRFGAQTGSGFRSDMAIDDLSLTLTNGGGGGAAPVADFSASTTTIDEGQAINFTDLSTGNPDSWSWTFAGGTPGNSTLQNPSVTYNTAGNYTVSLSVSNANGTDTETKNAYITVNPVNQGGSCTADISSFPYTESFESGLGAWAQSNGDDIDWTRESGGTPSNQTGPSGALDGNFYLYTEASGANSDKTAVLNSPCFDLGAAGSASFNFAYHMYGSNMGVLSVQASEDDGQTWVSLWVLSGNQGDQWQQAQVDLAAYLGSTVRLRFVGETGAGFRSDIAIDEIELTTGGGTSVPTADFTVDRNNITVGESISFTDLSSGNPTAWNWSFPGGTPSNSVAQNPTITYNSAGTFQVSLTVTNNDGADTETKAGFIIVNNAAGGNNCKADIASFPYTESFENTIGLWTQDNSDDMDWSIDANGTPSFSTGPSVASDGNFYIYTEASGSNSNNTAIITSPCFDLTTMNAPELAFDYHMYGSSMGDLTLQISTDDDNTWTTLWTESGDQGDQWLTENIDLSAYSAESGVRLRFIGLTGGSFRSDMALDHIRIRSSATRETANSRGDVGSDNGFVLAPNPVGRSMTVFYQSKRAAEVTIHIMDAYGRMVRTEQQVLSQGWNQFVMEVDDLIEGTYLLVIRDEEVYQVKRFLKSE